MSASTIFAGFRALLDNLSLDKDPDGIPLEEEALSSFESRADLDFLAASAGTRVGGFKINVDRVMRVRQGILVKGGSGARDTANKAQLAAETAIRNAFLSPSNHVSGCRKIHYLRSYRTNESEEGWILNMDFQIEYAETISA